jgi:hypothetical protein
MGAGDLVTTFRPRVLVGMVLAWASIALGYTVGPALSLEKLTVEADLVVKATALSGEPVRDEWFKRGIRIRMGHLTCRPTFCT